MGIPYYMQTASTEGRTRKSMSPSDNQGLYQPVLIQPCDHVFRVPVSNYNISAPGWDERFHTFEIGAYRCRIGMNGKNPGRHGVKPRSPVPSSDLSIE
ncbi:hypothetical protein RRG08_016155 [Elysia crispata]|uniref:Uncharacterized protein n=1 Tax=Elysia crispata TaxID=231223 RepID=A0AAE0Z2K7_9GAST|nr:hypothetical protein RRG08_016155 [Elysia crispata]